MALPKVLVATETYEKYDYVFPTFYHKIKNLTYPNYDFMVVDNSATLDYYRKLKRRGFKNIYHVERGRNSREAVARSLNFIRKKFLEGDYDYLLHLESDVIVPSDVIERLIKHQRPVVGGVYEIGYGTKNQPYRPCLFKAYFNEKGEVYTAEIPRDEAYAMLGTGLQQVHGMGVGCVLIEKWVLKRIKGFWWDERWLKHPDVFFYMDLHNLRIPVFADTDLTLEHRNTLKWDDVEDA